MRLISEGVYGKTASLVTKLLPRWGIQHDVFDPAPDAAALESLVQPTTRLIFAETISNPLLRIADLGSMATVAREAGIPLVVDNTFAPLICRPIEHGASLVVHSVTKMIGGHSDLTLGAVVGAKSSDRASPRRRLDPGPDRQPVRELAGPARSGDAQPAVPPCLCNVARAGRPLRVARRASSASIIPACRHILTSSSHRAFLKDGFGAIVTIDLGTRDRAQTFIRSLAEIPFAPSLGDVQTTLSHPASTSHRGQSDEQLARQGISAGMIRISVGIEDPGRPVAGVSAGVVRTGGCSKRLG